METNPRIVHLKFVERERETEEMLSMDMLLVSTSSCVFSSQGISFFTLDLLVLNVIFASLSLPAVQGGNLISEEQMTVIRAQDQQMSKNISIPHFVYELYEDMLVSDCNKTVIRTVPATGAEKTEAVFHFIIPPANQEDKFYKAEIRVIFPDAYCQRPLTLDLYWTSQRVEVSNSGANSEKSFFGRKQLNGSQSMCEISVDCTQLLEADSFNLDQKYSVSFELFLQQEITSSTIMRFANVSEIEVFAVLCYKSSLLCSESSAIFRHKRQVLKAARKQSFVTRKNMKLEAKHCSRKPLYVDMHNIGWDNWVISPKGFLANQCEGQCPFPISEHLNGTNHALIRSLLHTFSPDVEPACCVPIRLKPVTLLYVDDHNNVVLRQYENMAVEECGCR
ncbi:uncharacterized protein LOC143227461 [Tachypleus tridentatus]|uniref:uncharacterized protein LOC143227461 n=1 Tax=Tachypleus tridentatus TaxID=6853 RepID=UPI003FD3F203